MSPNGSQAPDVLDVEQLIIELSPKISKAVRYACRLYGHPTNRDEIRDLSQDILVLLLKNDCRVLRSFANRSPIETWLHTVVRRNLRPYLLRRRWEKENVSNVDDLSPDALSYQATQEEALIDEEERKAFHAIVSNLPERKRRLMELALQGLKSAEIAKEMGIKISSVSSEKSALFKEIRKLLEGR